MFKKVLYTLSFITWSWLIYMASCTSDVKNSQNSAEIDSLPMVHISYDDSTCIDTACTYVDTLTNTIQETADSAKN